MTIILWSSCISPIRRPTLRHWLDPKSNISEGSRTPYSVHQIPIIGIPWSFDLPIVKLIIMSSGNFHDFETKEFHFYFLSLKHFIQCEPSIWFYYQVCYHCYQVWPLSCHTGLFILGWVLVNSVLLFVWLPVC
uniref:Uncharacterized protein n=1 Tax=Cacopsylla melanoneura TaxID=428564 RepID=A0A8D9B3U0_9HEMI